MNHLTPAQLLEKAPAAKALESGSGSLIDTSAFFRFLDLEYGYKPVVAVQGTPHSDARSRAQGKHLVGAALANGAAVFLLNSHTVRRRAWIANGFIRQGSQGPLCLIGACLPLMRWRGFKEPLADLFLYRQPMLDLRREMMRQARRVDVNHMIQATVERAYLPGHKPVAREELLDVRAGSVYDLAFELLDRLHRSGLKAIDGRRKVKAMTGPDALMQAGNAIFSAAVECIGGTPLPRFRKT